METQGISINSQVLTDASNTLKVNLHLILMFKNVVFTLSSLA